MLATALHPLEASTRDLSFSTLAGRLARSVGLAGLDRRQPVTVLACEETGEDGSCHTGPGNQAPPPSPAGPPAESPESRQTVAGGERPSVLQAAVLYLTRNVGGVPDDEVSTDACEETGEDGSCHTGPGNQAPPPAGGPGEEPTPQSSSGSGSGSGSSFRELLGIRPALAIA